MSQDSYVSFVDVALLHRSDDLNLGDQTITDADRNGVSTVINTDR